LKFWEKQKIKAIEAAKRQSIDLLRSNIDWQIKYPQEAKNPGKHIHHAGLQHVNGKSRIQRRVNYDTHEPNPNIAKIIEEDLLRYQKKAETPAVKRPERSNRKVE
jgi:hypothetical protein